MNIYDEEDLELKLEQVTDLMGNFILDVVFMSLKKIKTESLIYQKFEARLESISKDDIEPDF